MLRYPILIVLLVLAGIIMAPVAMKAGRQLLAYFRRLK